MGLNWNEFDLPGKKLPKWKRTFAVDQETAHVFVAAALTGDAEHLVYICASDDGMPVYILNDHYYVPGDRLAAEFPAARPLYAALIASC
nr:hypothetical protein [uncultured Pseudomonas sp.]